MAQVIQDSNGVLTYFNHGDETWEHVCGTECLQNQSNNPDFDYDYVFSHKGSIKPFKPFAARHKTNYRWYKVRDDNLPAPVNDHLGRPKYVLTNNNIDENTYIHFFYVDKIVDEKKNYKEIQQLDHFVCNTMQSEHLGKKLLYYTETYCSPPSACSIQGGKHKHKSYHKRQQRRSKRRQQKSKRRQRK